MGELQTTFDWERACEELDKRYITFNLRDEHQKISDSLLIELVNSYFEWGFQNTGVSDIFSIFDIYSEVSAHNYDVLFEKLDIYIDYSEDYEKQRMEFKSEEDKNDLIDDLVAWHFEGEAYEYYASYFDDVKIGIYDNLAKYIADVLIDNEIMFELNKDMANLDCFPDDCCIYAGNCQISLLNKFSPQKTYNITLDEDIGFLIVPKSHKQTLLGIGGA